MSLFMRAVALATVALVIHVSESLWFAHRQPQNVPLALRQFRDEPRDAVNLRSRETEECLATLVGVAVISFTAAALFWRPVKHVMQRSVRAGLFSLIVCLIATALTGCMRPDDKRGLADIDTAAQGGADAEMPIAVADAQAIREVDVGLAATTSNAVYPQIKHREIKNAAIAQGSVHRSRYLLASSDMSGLLLQAHSAK